MPHMTSVTFLGLVVEDPSTRATAQAWLWIFWETELCGVSTYWLFRLHRSGVGTDVSVPVVDCAEGTVEQFTQQPSKHDDKCHRKMAKISTIFVTHMHGEFCPSHSVPEWMFKDLLVS